MIAPTTTSVATSPSPSSSLAIDRPIVTLADVCSEQELKDNARLISFGKDIFAVKCLSSLRVFRYHWQARNWTLLYKEELTNKHFGVFHCNNDAVIVQVMGSDLVIHRIGESSLKLVGRVELAIDMARDKTDIVSIQDADGLIKLTTGRRLVLIRIVVADNTLRDVTVLFDKMLDDKVSVCAGSMIRENARQTAPYIHCIVHKTVDDKGQARILPISSDSKPSDIQLVPAASIRPHAIVVAEHLGLPDLRDHDSLSGTTRHL